MATDLEDMVMDTLMAMVMATVLSTVDMVEISMESDHQRRCLKMVSAKGKLRLNQDTVLDLVMVLDLMDMDTGMVLGMVLDMAMVMGMGTVMGMVMERDP